MKTLTINFCTEIDGQQETGSLSLPLDDAGILVNVKASDPRGKTYVLATLDTIGNLRVISMVSSLRGLVESIIAKGEPQ